MKSSQQVQSQYAYTRGIFVGGVLASAVTLTSHLHPASASHVLGAILVTHTILETPCWIGAMQAPSESVFRLSVYVFVPLFLRHESLAGAVAAASTKNSSFSTTVRRQQ